jgi:glycosyltransferase involved in cell wall biosynthesis
MELSVVMSVYNDEKNIRQSVYSILDQTYRDFELIIVNDGSTDNTLEVLNQINDERIRLFNFDKNYGVSAARNFGIYHAKGSWIAVQDSDDYSYPTRLEEQLNYLRNRSYLGAVGSLIECKNYSNDGSNNYSSKKIEEEYNSIISNEQINYFKHYALLICHGSTIFSKKTFEQVGGYNPNYKIAHDYDLWLKMLDVTQIEKVNKILYQWNINLDSLHRKSEKETCNEVMLISVNKLVQSFYQYFGYFPRVTLIGSQEACHNFYDNILRNTNMSIVNSKFIDKSISEKELYYYTVMAMQKKQIDAVIVLEEAKSWEIISSLKSYGLTINSNLFHLWNTIN